MLDLPYSVLHVHTRYSYTFSSQYSAVYTAEISLQSSHSTVQLRPSKIIPLIPPIITELINNNNYSHYYRAGIPIIREPGQRGANRHVFCSILHKN